jgi:predicted aldo/keto reductase-like oxidoreductase
MTHDTSVSRRDFLRTSAAAGAAAAAIPVLADEEEPTTQPDQPIELVPKRKLGKTGVEVSILGVGAAVKPTPRYLNIMHSVGIRYIDTAKLYLDGESERTIADWLEQNGRRKEYFVVTKDQPKSPDEWIKMLDERMEALKTDCLDLFLLHGFGDKDYNGPEGVKWFTDKDWVKAADQMRKSGKVRFLGCSSHASPIELRTEVLNAAAAKGSWVDAIMVATNPTLMRDNKDFNRAVDACHQAGVGLISMKETYFGADTIEGIVPEFKKRGLSRVAAVLTTMWTDGRFACVCSHMDNIKYLKENADTAKQFTPLTADELAAVDRMLRRCQPTLCVACDGSCQRAAGTRADLNAIARYVTYAEQNGQLREARGLFAALPPEARDWAGANLHAASHACKSRLDFERILAKAKELLA